MTPLEQDVLLIWGEEDQLFPLEMALELKEILGKKVKLEVIRKTSHVPQIEHPKKFGKLVIDFLCGSDKIPCNSQRVRL
ncbi:hypothetical protein MLD38_014714 [Melastoma candidum]|uniref:Uncharacterized protein n=1 Tax=Melastoma candidum TaxID=119954 RepID=A0ACB9REU7_9MYRT|nr:hypothetical protein MLD38_014714 [Melastoma candidum]